MIDFYYKSNLHLHFFMRIHIVDQLEVVGELSVDFLLGIPAEIVSQGYH